MKSTIRKQNGSCPQIYKFVAQLEQEVKEFHEESFQGESRFQSTDNVMTEYGLCLNKKDETNFKRVV